MGLSLRSEQVAIGEVILKAIDAHEHALIEAPPGVGKTLAYLVAILKTNMRCVVATHTKVLQEQILGTDWNHAVELVESRATLSVLKGMSNYLCRRRLDDLPTGLDWELRKWSYQTETGDRSDGAWTDPQWDSVSASSETCTGRACTHYERCFVTKARSRASASTVIVVNHALYAQELKSRLLGREGILPEHQVLIVDEAHQFVATLEKSSSEELDAGEFDYFEEQVRTDSPDGIEGILRAGAWVKQCFETKSPRPEELREAFDYWTEHSERLKDYVPAARLRRRLSRFKNETPEVIRSPSGRWSLRVDSGDGRDLLESLHSRQTCIYISATLSHRGTLRRIRERLGLVHPYELLLSRGSETRALGVLYPNLPVPSDSLWLSAAAGALCHLVERMNGGAFVLCTSFEQVRFFAESLRAHTKFSVFEQTEDAGSSLVDEFRAGQPAVLVGTMRFWQGIDVPGEALRLVIVSKLPFFYDETKDFREDMLPEAETWMRQAFGRLLRRDSDRGLFAVLDPRLLSRSYGATLLASLPIPFVESVDAAFAWWEAAPQIDEKSEPYKGG